MDESALAKSISVGESLEDAVISGATERPQERAYRLVSAVFSTLLITLPIFLGGKSDFVIATVKICVSILGIYLIAFSPLRTTTLSRLGKRLFLLCGMLATVGILQITPMPFSILNFLSRSSSKLYQHVGANEGFISLQRFTSISSLVWMVSLAAAFFMVYFMPRIYFVERFSLNKVSSRHKNSPHLELLRTVRQELLVERLERALIISGIICSIIALAHWATGNEALFGLFGEQRAMSSRRAHWPFVNPNHLSVLLQMSIALIFSRLINFLHFGNLQIDKLLSSSESRRLQRNRLFSFAFLTIGLCVMILANVLTVSRMGNVLLVLILSTLWFSAQKLGMFGIRSPLSSVSESGSKDVNGLIQSYWKRSRNVFLVIFAIFVLLFFVGQKGRDIAVERLEHGLASNYDQVRALLNSSTVKVIGDYPLFGVGLGCWHLGVSAYVPDALGGWALDYAHNDYLQFISEIGLAGALFLVLVLWHIFVFTRSAFSAARFAFQRMQLMGYLLAVMSPAIHALVDFPFHIPATAFAFLMTVAMLLRYGEELKSANEQ